MTFGQAFENAKLGKTMYIPGHGIEVRVHIPQYEDDKTQPSYCYYTIKRERIKHTFSNKELFSTEWELK